MCDADRVDAGMLSPVLTVSNVTLHMNTRPELLSSWTTSHRQHNDPSTSPALLHRNISGGRTDHTNIIGPAYKVWT